MHPLDSAKRMGNKLLPKYNHEKNTNDLILQGDKEWKSIKNMIKQVMRGGKREMEICGHGSIQDPNIKGPIALQLAKFAVYKYI